MELAHWFYICEYLINEIANGFHWKLISPLGPNWVSPAVINVPANQEPIPTEPILPFQP